jgi:hypothetical protein
MNLGEILDRSVQIYRRQFWAFVAVGAIPALVVEGVSLADASWFHLYSSAVSDNHWTPGIYMTRGGFAIGYYHFASFVSLLLFPVILKLVSGLAFNNEEIKLREAWRFLRARWPRYLWLALLKLVAELVIVEIITVVLFVSMMEGLDSLGAKSFLEPTPGLMLAASWFTAGFAVFLWLSSSLSLAIPSAAIENLNAFRALRRSWVLTRGSRLRIALAWVALAVGSWVLSASFQLALRLVVISAVRSTHVSWIAYALYPILSRTLNTVLTTLFGPIFPIALTLFYYDQRIRHEGYDIERMMDAAGFNAPAPSPSAEAPATPAEAVEEQV